MIHYEYMLVLEICQIYAPVANFEDVNSFL